MKVIKIAKKDSANVVINFDNEELLFLSVEVLMKSGIRKDDEISDDRFLSLIRENQLFHIKQRAFLYLGRRLHSKYELKTKLLQKKYESELINTVLNELEQKKYLNDVKFAKTFAAEKIKTKLWGEKKLRAELIKKGINMEIISDMIKDIISEEDNYKNALVLAGKKYKSLQARNLNAESVKKKLITFLTSRGFNYDVINGVCEKLVK